MIQGKDPHNVKSYIESMWHYLEEQQYWQKLAELLQAKKLNGKNAEKVDKILARGGIKYGGFYCLLKQNSH
eukprot:7617460-Ditylum_brightwellii.AAC.1